MQRVLWMGENKIQYCQKYTKKRRRALHIYMMPCQNFQVYVTPTDDSLHISHQYHWYSQLDYRLKLLLHIFMMHPVWEKIQYKVARNTHKRDIGTLYQIHVPVSIFRYMSHPLMIHYFPSISLAFPISVPPWRLDYYILAWIRHLGVMACFHYVCDAY